MWPTYPAAHLIPVYPMYQKSGLLDIPGIDFFKWCHACYLYGSGIDWH